MVAVFLKKKKPIITRGVNLVFVCFLGLVSMPVYSGGTIKIDDTKWVSVGFGFRTSFSMVEDAAPSGNDSSKDFDLESMRLYLNGQVHELFKFTYKTERDGNNLRTLDAVAKFELNDAFNVWAGRFLLPSDRANLDGPYSLSAWSFPITSKYPAIFGGRDDGVAVWGDVAGGKLKYKVGMSEGCSNGSDCYNNTDQANQEDNLLYSARFTYYFWDKEPGYFTSSTTYPGEKELLTVGLVMQSQSDAVGSSANQGDFFGWNIDALLETKLTTGGVVTIEGAYNDYDLDDAPVTQRGGLAQGNGYFILGAYLFPQQYYIGKIQPVVRIQHFDEDDVEETDIWEIGANYVIDGYNMRLSAVLGNKDIESNSGGGSNDANFFLLGVQYQL